MYVSIILEDVEHFTKKIMPDMKNRIRLILNALMYIGLFLGIIVIPFFDKCSIIAVCMNIPSNMYEFFLLKRLLLGKKQQKAKFIGMRVVEFMNSAELV